MTKFFNIEGWCNPQLHFMADTKKKFEQIMHLINRGKYFTINRPHQYGKTTTLRLLRERISQQSGWMVLRISFEGLNAAIWENSRQFCRSFLRLLAKQLIENGQMDLAKQLKAELPHVENLLDLSDNITELVEASGKKIVLLIDEVDSSSHQTLFLEFLGMLRHKYLNRDLVTERTFHNVALVSIRDIKTLKLKIRTTGSKITYNSPWNIATDFEINMSFSEEEIIPMLQDYSKVRAVQLDINACANRLIYYTSGYPFLVSALCKILDEKVLPQKETSSWNVEDIDKAAHLLITSKQSNTNFDHLIKSLQNNPELYQLVFNILIDKQHHDYVIQNPIINLGVLYGIFGHQEGNGIKIHNRIYEEVIYSYMTSQIKMQVNMDGYDDRDDYLLPHNDLDIQKVCDRFQQFMQEQESEKDRKFLERNGTLLFLSFLQPIINGKGYTFKEAQISNEKRIDVIITYYQYKYIIELKIWRGPKKHKEGLKQLANYLKRQHIEKGYLLIFDFRKKTKSRDKKWLKEGGKRIYGVWI